MKLSILAKPAQIYTVLFLFAGYFKELEWTFRLAQSPQQLARDMEKESYQILVLDEEILNNRLIDYLFSQSSLSLYLFLSQDPASLKQRLTLPQNLRHVFLDSSRLKEELEEIREPLFRAMSQDQIYELKINKNMIPLSFKEIYYLEKKDRVVLFHTKKGLFEKRCSLKTLALEFEQAGFWQIHASFLINPLYITARSTNEIQLNHKIWLPLSRHRKKELKK